MADSITRAGMIYLVYTFMVVITYFLLSTPIALLFDSFIGGDYGTASGEMAYYVPFFETVLNIALAIFLAIPITWFVMWIFHREPAYYRYRRY